MFNRKIKDDIETIGRHLGMYKRYPEYTNDCYWICPKYTVNQKIDMLIDYLGLEIETKPAETKLVKRKKK